MSATGDGMAKRSIFVRRKQEKINKSSVMNPESNDLDIGNSKDCLDMSNEFGYNMMTNIKQIREMISNRSDPYDIFLKIVDELSGTYIKCCEIIRKNEDKNLNRCRDLNDQVVSLENDIIDKMNHVEQQSENNMNTIDLTLKCKDEVSILWITFTDPAEIENLRLKSKSDLIQETKKIFTRMNIKLDKPHNTIIDVLIQKVSVKCDNNFENELILGVKFTNAIVVSYMKRLITDYGKREFINKNFDLIRYSVRNYWSRKIWKLLRVCYDLRNFKLIEKVNVTELGIMVAYKKSENHQNNNNQLLQRKLIRNENDLNMLRSEIDDSCNEHSTFQIYNGDYFKLNFDERKSFRDNLNFVSSEKKN